MSETFGNEDFDEAEETYRADLIIFMDWFLSKYKLSSLDAEEIVDEYLEDEE